MAKPNEEQLKQAFTPYLQPGEAIENVAFGVKQPNILLIIVLMCLAVLPGIIATALLTKNYLIGTTAGRFVVLQIKGFNNTQVKEVIDYSFQELQGAKVKTSTGPIFTHIKVELANKPFVAKFHRAYSKFNRQNAINVCDRLNPGQAAPAAQAA